ncbi:OmpA family protein [Roseomonas sp. 18066]|uniref:OmpA family protein n=1 Tax=Roseomonas sp. 18066 TaxID=2681412 RepID=UPI001356C5C5|nr:OmpA family protein [Roseomonas sp. 18066]
MRAPAFFLLVATAATPALATLTLATLTLATPALATPALATPAPYAQSCYFDRGSLTLNARCRMLLAGAVRVWEEERDWQAGPPPVRADPAPGDRPWSGRPPRIRLTGHAQEQRGRDTDEQIAWRRAEAVSRALVALGVPAALIALEGRGAREASGQENGPQPVNRRVDLMIGWETAAAPPAGS